MTRHKILAAIIVFCVIIQNSWAQPTSSTDLWDVSQGVTVTAHSDLHHISNACNMFGNTIQDYQYGEGENTLFRDNQLAGYAHWIEWQTPEAVTVNSLNLVASHDSANTNYRAISKFNLYSWSGDSWNPLYSYDAPNPYGGGETYTAGNILELYDTFSAVTSQKFRAEFVQYSSDGYGVATGPRIHELDGYCTIPAPGSIVLAALGILSAVRRRKTAG